MASLVGIIANPASGKDIRRLVAYGSVFDNQEKVRMVRRVLLGLSAVGVDRVCYMPEPYGIVERALSRIQISCEVFPIELSVRGDQTDSSRASRRMGELGAGCLVTLGGDGTNRAVVKGNATVPILPLSTGTNNVFPFMMEATVGGLAAGIAARGLVPLEESTVRPTKLEILLDGEVVDLALVDAVVCDDLFIGSRAVWDTEKIRRIFLNRADPSCIGFASIGGLIHPIAATEPRGLCLELGAGGQAITAPIAPGKVETVRVSARQIMEPGEEMAVGLTPCILALDGEREVEIPKGGRAGVRLVREGPIVVDADRTMAAASARGVFVALDLRET